MYSRHVTTCSNERDLNISVPFFHYFPLRRGLALSYSTIGRKDTEAKMVKSEDSQSADASTRGNSGVSTAN